LINQTNTRWNIQFGFLIPIFCFFYIIYCMVHFAPLCCARALSGLFCTTLLCPCVIWIILHHFAVPVRYLDHFSALCCAHPLSGSFIYTLLCPSVIWIISLYFAVPVGFFKHFTLYVHDLTTSCLLMRQNRHRRMQKKPRSVYKKWHAGPQEKAYLSQHMIKLSWKAGAVRKTQTGSSNIFAVYDHVKFYSHLVPGGL